MSKWTREAIARINQVGFYRPDREAAHENDGRKATFAEQAYTPFGLEAEAHPYQSLTQPHMVLFGQTRHGLRVRVRGEEMGISPPWDEVTMTDPRVLLVDTRNRIRQAPPMQPTEFRTWAFTPEEAAAKGGR